MLQPPENDGLCPTFAEFCEASNGGGQEQLDRVLKDDCPVLHEAAWERLMPAVCHLIECDLPRSVVLYALIRAQAKVAMGLSPADNKKFYKLAKAIRTNKQEKAAKEEVSMTNGEVASVLKEVLDEVIDSEVSKRVNNRLHGSNN